jgi:hypothetical protein
MTWKRLLTDDEELESSSVFLYLESRYIIFVNKHYLYIVEHSLYYYTNLVHINSSDICFDIFSNYQTDLLKNKHLKFYKQNIMCHFGGNEILLPVKYYVSTGCKMSVSTKIRKIIQTRKKLLGWQDVLFT